ncbi:MAG: hypothetical protein ACR2K1_00880, partial [Saprospiraceae bacterium]
MLPSKASGIFCKGAHAHGFSPAEKSPTAPEPYTYHPRQIAMIARVSPVLFVLAALTGFLAAPGLQATSVSDSIWVQQWIQNSRTDYRLLQNACSNRHAAAALELEQLERRLQAGAAISCEDGYLLLFEKLQLEKKLRALEEEAELKILRLRFRKSIEMLKILYEKILGMDHHFSSLRAHQQIMRISNPHEYPQFKAVKNVLDERMQKKLGFALPAFMESNPYLSAVFSIIGLTLSNEVRANREQLDQIDCILDFTVRMHNDLNLIGFEAGYLHEADLSLKQECETLFADCTKPLGFDLSLDACRETDDWERLYRLLDHPPHNPQHNLSHHLAHQQSKTHLRFSIERVVRFIDRYCAFVNQGKEYYKKFARITDSYNQNQACATAL